MNQSVPMQFVNYGLAHVLSDVLQYASQTTVPGTLQGAFIGLFTAWPGFTLGMQMSQLTEPTYTGYARVAVTWGDQGIDKTARPQVMGSLVQFQPTGSAATSTAIGAFLASAVTGGNLIAVGLLTQAIVLGTPADLLGIIPRFAVPGLNNPDWGEINGLA